MGIEIPASKLKRIITITTAGLLVVGGVCGSWVLLAPVKLLDSTVQSSHNAIQEEGDSTLREIDAQKLLKLSNVRLQKPVIDPPEEKKQKPALERVVSASTTPNILLDGTAIVPDRPQQSRAWIRIPNQPATMVGPGDNLDAIGVAGSVLRIEQRLIALRINGREFEIKQRD